MTKPIKPSEIANAKTAAIPSEVFEVVNDLITRKSDGRAALIRQDEIIDAIVAKFGREDITRQTVFERNWLDFEEAYRAEGWVVVYDKPGYGESYPATFTFKAVSR